MPLTYRQKNTLKTIIVLLCVGCLLGGFGVLIWWADETASVQRFCSGSTLITITTDHGGSTGVAVTVNGC